MSETTSERELNASPEKNTDKSPESDQQSELIDSVKKSDIPEESKNAIVQQMEMFYSGPLPAPSAFGQYDKVLPGAAERILQMAEQEQTHRHEVDNKQLHMCSRDSLIGILAELGLGVVALVAGTVVALNVPNIGGTVLGGVFGVSGVGTIAVSIVKGTRTK